MTRKIVARIHLWVGLALCIPLVIISLTGSVLVFEDELQGATTGRAAASGAARPVAEIVAAARAAAPAGYVPTTYVAAAEPGEWPPCACFRRSAMPQALMRSGFASIR